jgi:hypothetical protein
LITYSGTVPESKCTILNLTSSFALAESTARTPPLLKIAS